GDVGATLVWGWSEDRRAESLHEATRVALVPWASQHHRRLAAGREALNLARNAQRIEEEQTLIVPERVRGDDAARRLVRRLRHRRKTLAKRLVLRARPVRVRRLPAPDACRHLAHGAMLREGCGAKAAKPSHGSHNVRTS